jgi:hypothetical protein
MGQKNVLQYKKTISAAEKTCKEKQNQIKIKM